METKREQNIFFLFSAFCTRGNFWIYLTLLRLLPLKFHCLGGCWDQVFGILPFQNLYFIFEFLFIGGKSVSANPLNMSPIFWIFDICLNLNTECCRNM